METSSLEKSPGRNLATELLSGAIGPSAFLDELRARDQSTGDRRAAIANIEILTQPGVAEFFNAHPAELPEYGNFLSLSYFHRGQIEAMTEGSNAAARASFAQALSWVQRAEAHVPDLRSWRLYVQGTLAYFEGDLATLREVYDAGIEEDRNREIIGNLITSLESGDQIDYRRAYGM